MKKKLLSMIVAVVFVMVSLLSTSVTVFAQSEEVEQKALEILTAIDEANSRIEKAVVMPEKLRNIVQIIGESEKLESAEALGVLEKIRKYVELVDQFNNPDAREGGIIGVVQAYSNYGSAMVNFSKSLTENDLEAVRNATYNMSKAAIQAFSDEMGNVIIGMLSETSEISKLDELEKIGELAVLTKIMTEFQAKMDGLALDTTYPGLPYRIEFWWQYGPGYPKHEYRLYSATNTWFFHENKSDPTDFRLIHDGMHPIQVYESTDGGVTWTLYRSGTMNTPFKVSEVTSANFTIYNKPDYINIDGVYFQGSLNSSGSADELKQKIITIHYNLHDSDEWIAYLESNNIEPVEIVKGDIDRNGVFNSIDFANMRMFLLGTKTFTDQQLKAADVNSDGSANAIDFAIMQQVILGTKAAFD